MSKKTLNKNLHKAKNARNDEFYTQLSDIEKEMRHYKDQFRGKVVYCNCDDPFESNFFKYFAANFNALGLKKLITTSYVKSPIVGEQLPLFEMEGLKPSGKEPFKIEIKEVTDINRNGAINLDDVEYLLKHDKNTATPLRGNGDFRSDECIELLKQADIVVTNPPFSLFREYVAQLVEYNKKFLVIGNTNAITYKEIFKLFKDDRIRTGFTNFNVGMFFVVPDDWEKFHHIDKNGRKIARVASSCWFTNLDVEKHKEFIILYKKYSPKEYPKYDNYDAINVDKYTDIPYDYHGVIGVPVTFIDKYNPEQFDLLGITDRQNTSGLRTKKYTVDDSPKFNDLNARSVLKSGKNYKSVYARLLIKNKKVKK
jgi:hypothetical protein